MKKLAVLLCLSGSALLSDPLTKQITINFSDFALSPGDPPVNVGSHYASTTGLYDPSPQFGTKWVAMYNYDTSQTVGSFLYHAPGVIAGSLGLFQSVSFSIAGGLSSAPAATLPITVLDALGNVLGEQDVAYTGGLGNFQSVTIPFAGQGAEIDFGKLGGLDASDYQFTNLVTWVDPAIDPPGDAPEPRYVFFAGAGLLLLGMIRKRRLKAV